MGRRRLGDVAIDRHSQNNDGAHESGRDDVDDLKSADAGELHRAVREEGQGELERPASSLFWSGLAGGIAITVSLIAEGALAMRLPESDWRDLIVDLGYPVGFIIVILGRMQLFTESTVTAMLPSITKPSMRALWRTLRLWGLVLTANLTGTAIVAAAINAGWLGTAELRGSMVEISMAIVALSPGETFVNAIPAGILIAMAAWVLPNARAQSVLVVFIIGYALAIGAFSHSIVGSVEAWLLLFVGRTEMVQTVFGLLAPAILGNLVGGAGIFALLAHAQVRGEMAGKAA
jgi:formate-nitrite transporter family protein